MFLPEPRLPPHSANQHPLTNPIRVHWRPFAVNNRGQESGVRSQESKAITRPNHTASIRVYQHPFMASKLSY
ncbi:MAG: hypothetical protein RI897_2148 [Verrucomicrobiota bacterium]